MKLKLVSSKTTPRHSDAIFYSQPNKDRSPHGVENNEAEMAFKRVQSNRVSPNRSYIYGSQKSLVSSPKSGEIVKPGTYRNSKSNQFSPKESEADSGPIQ